MARVDINMTTLKEQLQAAIPVLRGGTTSDEEVADTLQRIFDCLQEECVLLAPAAGMHIVVE